MKKLGAPAVFIAATMLFSDAAFADWVGEWFDQSTTTSAGGYGEQRYLVSRAMNLLGASNQTEAVARAMLSGQIQSIVRWGARVR